MANYCLINPNGEQITGVVKAGNGIRSSAKFWLWELVNGVFQPVENDNPKFLQEIAVR